MDIYIHIATDENGVHTYSAERFDDKITGVCAYRVARYVDGKPVYLPGVTYHVIEEGTDELARKVIGTIMAHDAREKKMKEQKRLGDDFK